MADKERGIHRSITTSRVSKKKKKLLQSMHLCFLDQASLGNLLATCSFLLQEPPNRLECPMKTANLHQFTGQSRTEETRTDKLSGWKEPMDPCPVNPLYQLATLPPSSPAGLTATPGTGMVGTQTRVMGLLHALE